MCGSSGTRAQREAQRAEDARRQQIATATAAIDRAFSGRGGQLDEVAAALREQFRDKLLDQKGDADRRLKFALARGGLTGGSAARDAGKQLGEEFQEGLLKGERGVQSSLADLAAADERSRQNLIALAQGGAGLTSSTQSAANALRSNLQSARATSLADDIGDIFSDTRKLYVRQEEAAARRRGLEESNVFADPFSR